MSDWLRKSINISTHVQYGKTTNMPKLLAFVDIFVEAPEMDGVLEALGKLEHLEELVRGNRGV